MGAELGRISGPLLAANLLRQGIDLAFETDLLYLDVTNGRIGIKTSAPTKDLLVNGTSNSTNLIVDTQFTVPNFSVSTNYIQNLTGPIYIQPDQSTDPKIVTDKLGTLNLRISDQLIENITLNSDINLSPNGTGKVVFNASQVYIDGNLHSTNNITADGNVIFGNTDADSTFFNSDIKSDLIPNTTGQYDLGSSLKNWKTLYANTVNTSLLESSSAIVNNIDMLLTRGNTYFVSVNGSDTNYGNHLHSTFKTLAHALSVAQSGDQIFIFSGTYEEEFPLTVPQGVTVTGESLRSVSIVPTIETSINDAFLLNGETTVTNLTIRDFYYDVMADTGYGFRFAPNAKVTSRSPYVQNISIITGEP